MRLIRLAAIAATALLVMNAASAQTTLRIGLAEDPDILDPTLARTYVGRIVFAALCDKLFDIDEELNIVPQLALGHEISGDGKVVTIKLRPGVKFHDGEPLDAEAVRFSLLRHLTMTGSFRKPEISVVERIEVTDPLKLHLVLSAPFSPLITQLTDRAGMIVSPKAAKAAGDKFGLSPVCAGPYKFVERVQQDRIVVEKFQDYWDNDNVHIDRIVYLPIVDSTARLANLKSGAIDLIERVLATDIKNVRSDSRLKLTAVMELGYQSLTINVANGERAKNPLGESAKVRQALNLAIDREALTQVVFDGEYIPGNQWVNPEHPYFQESLPIPKRDVAKAKALLKEAGINGLVAVDLMVPQGPASQAVAEVIQNMAGEVGFDIKIRITEFATSLKQGEAGEYQARLIAWSGRIDPDGNVYVFNACNAPQNTSGYCNKEVDKLLDEARIVSDRDKRKAIYWKAAKTLLDESPIVYLYHRRLLIAHTARLEGYRPMPDGLVRVVGLRLK